MLCFGLSQGFSCQQILDVDDCVFGLDVELFDEMFCFLDA
ncbi:hypothetical protein HMPREF9148_01965 [Prevotella sp. F0091]|nr:hypothetical protein HMPREF9148_01965 [Prevotella sp. F0091]